MVTVTVEDIATSIDVPPGSFANDAPLIATLRASRVETIHRGTFAVASADGRVLASGGDVSQRTFIRSSAKPFQAMALILTGTADAFGLTDEDIAIACASHSGEPEHIRAVTDLLQKAQISYDDFRCGVHAPNSSEAARNLVVSGTDPSVLHNNCSGKHAGMLAVCAYMGWPAAGYLSPEHPLQILNLQTLSTFTGRRPEVIELGVDGCGVPTFYVQINDLALAFARLATGLHVPTMYQKAAARIRKAMSQNPTLVGGTDRFDTVLMGAGDSDIVSKGGAAGCQGIGLITQGLGIGLKMSDGVSHLIPAASYRILEGLGVLSEKQEESLSRYDRPAIRNHAGTVTGEIQPTFRLDLGRA